MILLPILTFPLIYLLLRTSRPVIQTAGEDWRREVLLAIIYWGLLIVASVEILSLFHGLRGELIAAVWLLVLTSSAVLLSAQRRISISRRLFDVKFDLKTRPLMLVALIFVAGILALLFLIAMLSPPNTMDALLYHLPRIMHWLQNGSLEPYSTQYVVQLMFPPWPEMAILTFVSLGESDETANLIQWLSLVGSLIGVSGIVSLLGGSSKAQLLALVFALSVPMAILQATSSQTDLVVTIWIIAMSYLVIVSQRRSLVRAEILALGGALGLSVITKATAYVLAFPLIIWYLVGQYKRGGVSQAIRGVLPVAFLAAVINLGYWGRNISAFGRIFGPSDVVNTSTILGDPTNSIQGYPIAIIRAVLVNFVSPWEELNSHLESLFDAGASFFSAELLSFPLTWAWNHEDLAGNPVHIVVGALALIGLIYLARSGKSNRIGMYAVACASVIAIYPLILSYSSTQIGIRYQLPIFFLIAPIVGLVAVRLLSSRVVFLMIFFFIFLSFPWVLFNSSRPLIGMTQDPKGLEIDCTFGCTRIGSILEVSRQDLLFANSREIQEPATSIVETLALLECDQVGLRIDSHDPEYPYWQLIGAPVNGSRIETLYPVYGLGRLLPPSFRPCAIICTICDKEERLHGLDLLASYGGTKLFVGDEFRSDPRE